MSSHAHPNSGRTFALPATTHLRLTRRQLIGTVGALAAAAALHQSAPWPDAVAAPPWQPPPNYQGITGLL